MKTTNRNRSFFADGSLLERNQIIKKLVAIHIKAGLISRQDEIK
nr:MAG TPA: hypothetical protein [Caudoviricetes sp.]